MEQILITPEALKQAIREVLAEFMPNSALATHNARQEWFDTDPAYSMIGVRSARRLRAKVLNGTLRQGIDWRDDREPGAERPSYRFHVENCKKRLAVPPEKRKLSRKAQAQ
jgi:hypothetical protein